MKNVTLTLDKDFTIAEVDPRLFGGFVEHLGRHIYTGIYEPGHPTADEQGWRQDVIELTRELRMPIMRYPGGNFVSGYRWEDGVGPVDQRPARLDLAWGAKEPNTIGTNEFADWCKKVGTEPMMAVNLGTRGPAEAQALVEYCNHPGGTYWSDWRKSHGWAEPHNIRVWCLGNEMDGPWQMGARTATEYGRVANEAAKMMKWTDPTIETVLCGSSGRGMRTFGKWEWEALHEAYDHTDYLSLHTYYGNRENDTPAFLAEPDNMSDFIRESIALCDGVKASRKAKKRIDLSFDEWNVWFHSHGQESNSEKWSVGRPILEDIYTMEDALVVGGMLITLLSHADRVRIGCIAQVVNVIGPIMTEPNGRAWRQTIFHPFAQASAFGRGTVLQSVVKSPVYDSKVREKVDIVRIASVLNDDGLTIFAVNRDPAGEPVTLSGILRGIGAPISAEQMTLTHADLKATNSAGEPNKVAPRSAEQPPSTSEQGLTAVLPPFSWNVLRVRF
ncbi:MAG: alpha-N-arabinofuranosidase [Capsulimonadales bacterium]|nr:alpha-N-arabinofuranosidase [Capsulimonadales bacterium]